jgi:uncharacterized protein (DUF1684 family)
MKFFNLIILFLSLISCSDIPSGAKNISAVNITEKPLTESKKQELSPEKEFEFFKQKMNEEFTNPETSPLEKKDLKHFKSLAFFPFNKDLIVTSQVELTPDTNYFGLPTTTSRMPNYRQYALLHFKIAEKAYTLPVYQSKELHEGYEDYLFLPFSDLTNDDETYGGGRYIDIKIPKGKTMLINFNYAYNPYCAYNHKYSCPKIPKENNLDVVINAGVKKFH